MESYVLVLEDDLSFYCWIKRSSVQIQVTHRFTYVNGIEYLLHHQFGFRIKAHISSMKHSTRLQVNIKSHTSLL